ncbi:spindle and centriole-associated protein 1 isoform X2 [Bufo gargarizans]|uniref:spindle and centriole-associated protein 1 isoform X2 n=1 Tax=Bufo gargarizans TaxID=30331 RepID=UPI001CF32E9F|nr:spindle and centriole-associated protein 1 isoform X2 [Bufo gargarizans]
MAGRHPRSASGRSGVKKAAGGRKKSGGHQAWDSSIHDLGVHRATPEELAHRHEIHKSKNQSLAQWELKKKEWRRQNGGTPDPLEDRRLALMMEILSDQYQMTDVLQRSDRAMAVVKDLFGDAPRRHTGFPNVTMAPSCDLETSRGPIAQTKDPRTRLSILSESIMDSQALNEVEGIQSEDDDDDDDVDVSISFQPALHTDKVRRILNEESSRLASEEWSRDKVLGAQNPLVTPKGAGHPPNGGIALNATAAVNKLKTRLTEEEQEEPEASCVIGRVLNPQPPNHRKLQSKGKKKRPPHVSGSQRGAPPCELSGCSQSGLDVLNQMIQEVERELETYERETGRAVSSVPQPQGLSGFTLTLISSIRRLVSYLKESDRRLRQESLERQRLKDELSEQRLLIDALTAEILAIKDGSSLSPVTSDHVYRHGSHCLMSDHSQSSPGDATMSLPVANTERVKAPVGSAHAVGFLTEQGSPNVDRPGAPLTGHDATTLMTPSFREAAPLLDFQPAVMLSPPRQETRADFRDRSAALLSRHDTVSSPSGIDLPSLAHDPDPAAQSLPRGDALVGHHRTEEPGNDWVNATTADANGIVTRMAELSCQNNALKAQLEQLRYKTGGAGDSTDASHVTAENKEAPPAQSPVTLDMRIAELNRQSAEARDKLLRLIEQQKQSLVVSPAISPITPQLEEPGRRARLIDAVLPMPQFTDSSIEETPSPGSGRRSSASQRSNSSVSGSSRQRVKVKDKEEGWFALSTHVL